ncbi:MAG: glycosyltransferase family 2 protein [Proteobacteria bacterium]|nr:glycosyltransferase family 2 protein [Pseudomonadota bacterium]
MLAMLLLVRDEADIVEHTIRFHLNRGVDVVLATDNGSTDGTVEILQAYQRQGVVDLAHSADEQFRQGDITTAMAHRARERFGARWVLPCDADEFWCPAGGDLKRHLAASEPSVLLCRSHTMLSAWERATEPWSFAAQPYRVARPLSEPPGLRPASPSAPATPSPPEPFVFYETRGKALFRTQGLLRIHQGNHDGEVAPYRPQIACDILIRHFPVRTWEQFRRKVRRGGAVYRRNAGLDWRLGWHWRRWLAIDDKGMLETEFRRVLPNATELAAAVDRGIVEPDSSLAEAEPAGWRQRLDDEADRLYPPAFFEKHEPWESDYRHLARVLAATLEFATVADFGCGNGFTLRELKRLGKHVFGVDGSAAAIAAVPGELRAQVESRDLRLPFYAGRFDLVLSTEVAEHLEAPYAETFISSISRAAARHVVFSAATPEQIDGVHHVNLREPDYWIRLFAKLGFAFCKETTTRLRNGMRQGAQFTRWLPLNLLAFERPPACRRLSFCPESEGSRGRTTLR